MLDDNKQKKWLIKDDDHITGPFTENEIQERLESGRISPAAMACMPDQNCWIFIINYSEFTSWAEKISATDTNLTKTLSSLGSSSTLSFDSTTSTFSFNARTVRMDRTDTPFSTISTFTDDKQFTPISSSQKETELPYQVVEEESSLLSSNAKQSTTYKYTILKWSIFTILLLSGGLYMWFLQNQKKTSINNTKDTNHFTRTGQLYFSAGYYLKAITHWKQAKQSSHFKKQHDILLKITQLQFQNRIDKGKQLLQSNTNKSFNAETKNIIQALIYVKNKDDDSAIKYFTKLANQAQSEEIKNAAKINGILLAAKKGNCKKIQNEQFYNSTDNALASIIFTFCFLSTNPSLSNNPNHISKIKEILYTMTQNPQTYYQEAMLALAYISLLEKQPNKTLSLIQKLLDTNPFLTEEYYYNVFIDRKIYTWPAWTKFCKEIYQSNKNNKFYITFYAYCLSRSGQFTLARQHIKKAHTIDGEDPLIKAIYAYTIYTAAQHKNSNNTTSQFVFILSDAVDSNEDYNYFLPYIMQARFCEKNQDWGCAIRYWQMVLQNDPISSYAGIANVYYHKKMYKEARQYVGYGLEHNFSKRYKPLLLVDRQLKKHPH